MCFHRFNSTPILVRVYWLFTLIPVSRRSSVYSNRGQTTPAINGAAEHNRNTFSDESVCRRSEDVVPAVRRWSVHAKTIIGMHVATLRTAGPKDRGGQVFFCGLSLFSGRRRKTTIKIPIDRRSYLSYFSLTAPRTRVNSPRYYYFIFFYVNPRDTR